MKEPAKLVAVVRGASNMDGRLSMSTAFGAAC
jgi:hypothetical protein